jgi:transcriptional regulator with XRE-family HTH domain
MGCQPSSLGVLLRQRREHHHLTQRELALRAGTSQDAISRIERGAESPTFERFRDLLTVMGERPVVQVEPLLPKIDRDRLAGNRAMSARERLRESASWNLVATRLEIAGAEARRASARSTRKIKGTTPYDDAHERS